MNQPTQPTSFNLWMEVVSGHRVNLIDPDHTAISLDDIATSLSRIPLYLGHTQTELPYTVAMRSIWIARYLCMATGDAELALLGILSDAHKALIGDIPKPLRCLQAVHNEMLFLELSVQPTILQAMQAPELTPARQTKLHEAKSQALAVEAMHLIPSEGHDWDLEPINLIASQLKWLPPIHSHLLKFAFIRYVENLREGILV